jgi:isopenicillin-N N-acyltransferase-like protein
LKTGMLRPLAVSGTHYDCGLQIGRACAEALRAATAHDRAAPLAGRWDAARRAAAPYLAATARAFPWVVEELRGAAEGAGVDFLDLFVDSIEELATANAPGRCSDFAAAAPATVEGRVLLGHNNDLAPETAPWLTAVAWDLPDQPRLLTIGVGGIFVSIGVNAAGLALTGNELQPNDERPGIPRLLIARALLGAATFEAALAIALHPERASSYNNLISSRDGRMVSVEGSATDHELLWPEAGWLVHTNHYVHPRMQRYERAPDRLAGSRGRYARAHALMTARPGPVSAPMLRGFLADHGPAGPEGQGPDTPLCRHAGETRTVFSAVIDLTAGTAEAALGNPCAAAFTRVWG